MARKKRLNIWLNDQEYEKLKKFAKSKDLSMSELLRDFVKSLPDV
jgi:predicted CopG family antitoxin